MMPVGAHGRAEEMLVERARLVGLAESSYQVVLIMIVRQREFIRRKAIFDGFDCYVYVSKYALLSRVIFTTRAFCMV